MHYFRSRFMAILAASLLSISLAGNPGELLWSVTTGDIIFGAPAIGPNGEIVVGSYDRKVYSYNPDGTLRWSSQVGEDWLESSPTIAPDGTIYIGSWDGFLYAVDGNSGVVLWSFETGGVITGSPAIGPNGTIYIGSNDGYMYAISQDGELQWFSGDLSEGGPISSAPVFNHSGDTLYFGTDVGMFIALSASNGAVIWSFDVTDVHPPSADSDYGIVGSAALDTDGSIYFGCENSYLYALDPEGTLRWFYQAAEAIRSSPVISITEVIHFLSQDGFLYFIDVEGYQIWETFVGDVLYSSPAIDALGNIIVAGYAGSAETGAATDFTCVSSAGDILWEYRIDGVNDSSPNIGPDGSIYIGAHNGNLYKIEGYADLMKGPWPRLQGNRRHSGFHDDLTRNELIDHFPGTTVTANGWSYVPWFGSGWIIDEELPWMRHTDHGIIYLHEPTPGSAWFYDIILNDWIYATSVAPYYYYQYGTSAWLFHIPETTVDSGRWFWNFSTADWITDPS